MQGIQKTINFLASTVSAEAVKNCWKHCGFRNGVEADDVGSVGEAASFLNDLNFEGFPFDAEFFYGWADEVDRDIDIVQPLSDEAIITSVMETHDDSDNDEDEREMEAEEPNPPSIKEMREAMRILKRGLQAQGFNFHTLSRFESEVDKTLQKRYKQSTLNKFLGKE